MNEYAPLVEGDALLEDSNHFSLEDKNLLTAEQLELLRRIGQPLRTTNVVPLDRPFPGATTGYCLCQNRFDAWKRYYCELRGTQLVIRSLKKGSGEAGRVKTVMDVRFVTFAPLSLTEKEAITGANLSTDCTERFRVFGPEKTRVIVPAAAVDFEKWSNALHSMLETHLDADELERRRTVAKDVEPLYQRHSDYLQKKGQLIMRSFAQVGFMENEKKNCMRQGVVSLQNDEGVWKKSFLLLKKFVATYHESGKSYKKGFINLKLARVERSAKSAKRFKIITPMCVYSIKARHEVDANDWISAITAAAQGKSTYDGAQNPVGELDNVSVPPFTKPYVTVGGRKYKIKEQCVIGRSSACTVCITNDKKISREHVKIEHCNGKWLLRDMGSHSGTKLNGAKVTEHVLKPGDIIELGSTTVKFGGKAL